MESFSVISLEMAKFRVLHSKPYIIAKNNSYRLLMLMGRVIYYNILRDGDNTLKGLIAEKIFERVKHLLIGFPQLQCCSTLNLAHLLLRGVHKILDLETIISKYGTKGALENELAEVLRRLRLYVGVSEKDIDPETTIHNSLYGCPLCLRDSEVYHEEGSITLRTYIPDCNHFLHFLTIRLCSTCYEYLSKKRYIKLLDNGLNTELLDDELYIKLLDNGLESLFCTLGLLQELYRYRDAIRILARLDKEDRELLLNIYARPGGRPFDYICIDEKSNKYLVDVSSTAGIHRASPLSKRERELIPMVKARGFKILIPVVEYLGNWNIRVELREI
jgi:hypothetical protein